MSDEKFNDNPMALIHQVKEFVQQHTEFFPTDVQLMTKQRFWRTHHEDPLKQRDEIDCDYAVRLTGDQRLRQWWKDAAFRAWFLNNNHIKEAIGAAAEKAAKRVLEWLDDPKYSASAKSMLAKLLWDIADLKPPTRKDERWADSEIQKMSAEDLEEFLKSQGVNLKQG